MPLVYLAAVSVPLAVTDARTSRLPNTLVVPGLAVLAWAVVGVGDLGRALPILVACSGAAVVFGGGWRCRAVGMGDVKLAVLLAGVAALTDARVLTNSAVAAALLTVGAAAGARRRGRASACRIPLGPPLLAGFWWGAYATWLG